MAPRFKSPYTVAAYGTSLTTKRLSGDWAIKLADILMSKTDRAVRVFNSGKGSQNSQWGIDNLQEKVISHNPRHVLIEFAINAEILGISRAQEIANMTAIVAALRAKNSQVDITLMTMNPVSAAIASGRPNLAAYYQDVRDLAVTLGTRMLDNYILWPNPMDPGFTDSNDGLHPTETVVTNILLPNIVAHLTPIILAAPDYI